MFEISTHISIFFDHNYSNSHQITTHLFKVDLLNEIVSSKSASDVKNKTLLPFSSNPTKSLSVDKNMVNSY